MRFQNFALESVRTIVSLAILLIGVAAFAAISQKEPPVSRPETAPAPLLVQTAPVGTSTSTLDLQADGIVVPYREIRVASEVSGRVVMKSARVRPGLIVRKGDVIAEIDRETYELEVQRLAVEVQQALSNLNELEVEQQNKRQLLRLQEEQVALRHTNVDRLRELAAKKIVPDADVEEARRQELEADNQRSILQNEIAQIEAKRKTQEQARQLALVKQARAQVDLQRTRIVAPCDGVVLTCQIEENSYVTSGNELCLLEDISAVDVRSNLRMQQLQWILHQQPATPAESEITGSSDMAGWQAYALPPTPVTVRYSLGGRKFEWQGELVSYDGLGIDERTRTVPVRIRVKNPLRTLSQNSAERGMTGPRSLVRGMYVEILLHVQPLEPLLQIPEESIQPGGVVWCVRDGKLARATVTVAQSKSPDILLDPAASTLQPDDRLVVSPIPAPIIGMAVTEEARP